MAKKSGRSRRRIALAALWAGAAFLPTPILAGTREARPWEGPPFAASPASILSAVSALPTPDDAAVEVLFREERFDLDESGRETHHRRLVYRILSPAGIQHHASLSLYWAPWFQERPSMRARVIAPNGLAQWLDSNTIAESPGPQPGPNLYGDLRALEAPLPAVAIGAIVESEFVIKETAPFFDAGVASYVPITFLAPVRHVRVVVDRPSSMPFHHVERSLPSAEVRETEGSGRATMQVEVRDLRPPTSFEIFAAPDPPQRPYMAFATGASWSEVAGRYGAIVDRRIGRSDVRRLSRATANGATTREEIAERLWNHLRERVRYTGVEFGNAVIIPSTPEETLERGYGDCKDQAVLLVAMLRAVGVEAHVALLRTGPGSDVEAGLPGLGGFDHAIVFVPGEEPLWIDPSDRYARVNELPAEDQGRLALIAADDTTALIKTPRAAASDNRQVEIREFFLNDRGPARLVETTEAWGSFSRFYRWNYASGTGEDVQRQLETYVKTSFMAETLGGFEYTDPEKMSVPFRVRCESPDAGVGYADDVDGFVAVSTASLFQPLLPLIEKVDFQVASGWGRPPARLTNDLSQRKSDLILPDPYQAELEYRIHPPLGFVPGELPPGGTERLGPVLLEKEFTTSEEGVVLAKFKLETLRDRFSPAEARELKAGLEAIQENEPLLITFKQEGEAYLEAGLVQQALEEFRRLAALRPHASIYRAQIARALVAAGLGEPAREEARRAVSLDPNDSIAHAALGWVLEHDLVGRRFGRGADLAGAEAAYRKAIELDPENTIGLAALAILLEHDAEGVQYGPEARLEEAIALHRALREESDDRTYDGNLLHALLRTEQFEEVEKLAREIPQSPPRDAVLLAAVAARRGSDAALLRATRLESDAAARSGLLAGAGLHLASLYRYKEASQLLFAAAGKPPADPATRQLAESLKRARRHEEARCAADNPLCAARRFLHQAFLEGPGGETLSSTLSREASRSLGPLYASGPFELLLNSVLQRSLEYGLPRAVAADLLLGTMQLLPEGDARHGYRILMIAPGATARTSYVAYLVREDGGYRVKAMGGAIGAIGLEALDRIDDGDLAGARRWLEWAAQEMKGDGSTAGAWVLSFPTLWERDSEPEEEWLRRAAAALVAESTEASRAVPILEEARRTAGSGSLELNLDLSLARAHVNLDRPADLLPVARRLAAIEPQMGIAFEYLTRALLDLERWDECRGVIEERLERKPEEPIALRAFAELQGRVGRYGARERLLQRILQTGRATPWDKAAFAWNSLFTGQMGDEAIPAAEQAVQESRFWVAPFMDTLAALYAADGRITEAHSLIVQSMEVSGLEEPGPEHWYVLGRIAESLDLTRAAASAYRKVARPAREQDAWNSTHLLAARRLAALGEAVSETKESSASAAWNRDPR